MNGKNLLIGLSHIDRKFIEESENDTVTGKSGAYAEPKRERKGLRRPLLIAAIIALMLVLMGCAVAYALRLQDMSIGKDTYIQRFDDEGRAIEPTEKTMDVITIYGHSGDNIQKATAEWFAFLETYDPNGTLMDNNPDHAEIPNRYEYTYGCYTQDMVDKVDEIAEKYDLKLLEEWIPFQAWQSDIFFAETGVGSFLLPGSGAETGSTSGMFYPPYNFEMDFELATDKLDGKLWVTALYARKDYFPKNIPGGMDLSLFEQWDYTAPDGTALLLALSGKGHGYIIAEPENAMLIYSIDGNFSSSDYPTADEVMTKEQLESVADLFDYSIKPEILDRTAVEQKLEEAQKEYDAAHAYAPETYGSFSDVVISKYTVPNENAKYIFYDLTGDGIEELLTDYTGDGSIDEWFTIQDGEVQFYGGDSTYLCEGHVLEDYYEDPERGDYHMIRRYTTTDTETAWMDTDPETNGDSITVVSKRDGHWSQADEVYAQETEISEETALKIMAQYPRIQLDWQPVMDYPISETQTLRDYLEEKDVRVSGEELRELYRQYLTERESMHYSHYRILDINGDGVDDLLLKGEENAFMGKTDYYWLALTYRYGRIEGFAADFYLCEDGVLEHVEMRHAGGFGVEKNGHQFLRYDGFEEKPLEFVAYNKSTAGWQTDWWDEEPISEEEANAILAKYPRIDQGMRPISELLN